MTVLGGGGGIVYIETPFALQNRELQIMRKLDHCNIVRLRYFFYSSGEKVRCWNLRGRGVATLGCYPSSRSLSHEVLLLLTGLCTPSLLAYKVSSPLCPPER